MRYQYPAPNPIGHYWEEDVVNVLGARLDVSKKTGQYLSYILSEVIFANIFLALQFVFNQVLIIGLQRSISRIYGQINAGAIMKRSIDIIGASIGLIITLPFWLLVAAAIRIDSRGPIFYRQERVGHNRRRGNRRAVAIDGIERRRTQVERRQSRGFGKAFMIIKFRSMYQNAEAKTGPTWASKNDSRITRVGRFIRATRLDEMPQLLNVLAGDMSLVGPRPERPFFVCDLNGKIKNYTSRFDVKPGITGLAQVEHKYDECLEDVTKKVSYDLRYIRNWSIFQDLKIILRTVVVVLTARGM
jgi:lipopolysaccharide/colanic/teichoic acid biosynthesis glycosyltransferase